MSHPSAFKTLEGEARYLAAYDAALKLWPVPYDEIDISTRFGRTHVVVSGPNDAPPLVLLHEYMASRPASSRTADCLGIFQKRIAPHQSATSARHHSAHLDVARR